MNMLRQRAGINFRITRQMVVRTGAGLALFTVFLLSGFVALRIAIHGREVTVPNLSNLSDTEAADTLKRLGLNLSVENRFYATTVATNHVLSQSPGAGSSVRRGWQIRVTESLGTQQVPMPDITGQDQHPASLILKRLQLELGNVAHLPGPGPTGTVLAQSPPPNVPGINGPKVSVLVADDPETEASVAFVMPSIVGMTLAAASSHLESVGLHVAVPEPDPVPVEAVPDVATGDPAPVVAADPVIPPTIVTPPPVRLTSTITSQTPAPGRRVSRADTVRVTLSP